MDTPRHEVGGMRYFRGNVGIISGAPFVNTGGSLVYPMLVDGIDKEVAADSIGKRRQKV